MLPEHKEMSEAELIQPMMNDNNRGESQDSPFVVFLKLPIKKIVVSNTTVKCNPCIEHTNSQTIDSGKPSSLIIISARAVSSSLSWLTNSTRLLTARSRI